jgi:hypothetical protein
MPPPAAPAPSLGDATIRVIALAFDLAESEIQNLDTLLQKSLNEDPRVRDAISSALSAFVSKRMASGAGTSNMSGKDALELVKALQAGAGSQIADSISRQIKDTPEYKRLENALGDLQNAAQSSPMGVWVSKNDKLLIVVGLALVLGGSAALYITKTGSGAFDFAIGQVVNKPLDIVHVGKFILQGQLLAFQPATRTIGAGLGATEKWQKVAVTVQIGVVAAGANVQKIDGSVVIKTDDVNVSVTGSATPAQKKINLGLSLGFNEGSLANLKVGIGAIITDNNLSGGAINAALKTQVGEFGGTVQEDGKEFKSLLTFTRRF